MAGCCKYVSYEPWYDEEHRRRQAMNAMAFEVKAPSDLI
jgi:hypothetical protein